MTFLVCVGNAIAAQSDDPKEALGMLADVRNAWPAGPNPDAVLAEVLILGADPRTAIPGELDRAIDAWNLMTTRVHFPKVRNRSLYLKPYRRWISDAGQRDYFLEQVVAMVEATRFCWPWIKFGKLLGKTKDGDLHSEMLIGEQWKRLKPMEDVSDMVIRAPYVEPEPMTLKEKVLHNAPIAYEILGRIGDPDESVSARIAFNERAYFIESKPAADRWTRWKEACAETGVPVRFNGGVNV